MSNIEFVKVDLKFNGAFVKLCHVHSMASQSLAYICSSIVTVQVSTILDDSLGSRLLEKVKVV